MGCAVASPRAGRCVGREMARPRHPRVWAPERARGPGQQELGVDLAQPEHAPQVQGQDVPLPAQQSVENPGRVRGQGAHDHTWPRTWGLLECSRPGPRQHTGGAGKQGSRQGRHGAGSGRDVPTVQVTNTVVAAGNAWLAAPTRRNASIS